jgi:hypothetical protein
MRQSLWLNPQGSTTVIYDSHVTGYLADGFFDRGAINTTWFTSGPNANTTVGWGTVNVAYRGSLFFNDITNASVFFPASGFRFAYVSNTKGQLTTSGTYGYYWSSSSNISTSAWALRLSSPLSFPVQMTQEQRGQGNFVRCVQK